MQDSISTNSISKPKPRKSLRLRKKRFSNKFQSEKCLLNNDLILTHQDSVDSALGINKQPQSLSDGQVSDPRKSSNDMFMYSSVLLELCNKLTDKDEAHRPAATNGCVRSNQKRVPLYSPLTQDSLQYPYANLLLGLHKKVATSHRQTPKQQHQMSPDRSFSRIMNDFKHPIDPNANKYKINCDSNTTNSYTKKMQNFVILEALRKTLLGECESPSSGCDINVGDGATVGEVMSDLGQQRARELYPSDEFYYSSLLLKACSAHSVDQSPDFDMVSNGGGDTDGNTSSYADDRDCSTSSKSSDSYEEWSPSYRKRKVRKVRRRSTKNRLSGHELSVPVSASPGEAGSSGTHQNKAPTLLKLLLSKDSSYNTTGADSLPPQSRTAAATSNVPSQSPCANALHGSLLKNFLSKPSDEFQKYYSKIRENRENSSPRTSLQSDSESNGLHGQSQDSSSTSLSVSKGNKKETSSVPDLIPCSLLSDTTPSYVSDHIKSEAREVDDGCTFLEEHENKPVPQAMSLTVASMLCRLKLYPPGDGEAAGGDLMAPCTASVSSSGDKQGLGTGGVGRCRGTDDDTSLEEHQCSLCHLPFVSSLDLQCHQSLFHAAHSSSEKLRN